MSLVLGLPAVWQMILYALAAILGLSATYYLGNWIAGWANEIKDPKNASDATDGRSKADSSDQNLNDQTDHLPKG